jgi:hypothetical protein
MNTEMQTELKNYILDRLNESVEGIYGCDLHNEIFNTDYYCVYYYQAEKFMNDYGGAFKAIHRVKEYEMSMFGEVYTDLSDPIKVANMLAYTEGEVILYEANHLHNVWDNKLSIDDINIIKNQIEEYI